MKFEKRIQGGAQTSTVEVKSERKIAALSRESRKLTELQLGSEKQTTKV